MVVKWPRMAFVEVPLIFFFILKRLQICTYILLCSQAQRLKKEKRKKEKKRRRHAGLIT
jgi:hypothetical protein